MTELNTGQIAGAEPVIEPNEGAKPSEDAVPWDKDERWQAWKAEEATLKPSIEKLNKILEANDLDDIEDLVELVESGKKVKGKLQDPDQIDALIAKAERLEKIEEYWKDQEERKKRDDELPADTIARLEAKLREQNKKQSEDQKSKELAEQSKKAISFYEDNVGNLIEDSSIPKEQRDIIQEFLGVGNLSNDIDITDKRAIKKIFQDTVKKFEDYDQLVIKQYLEGKKSVPALTKTEPALNADKQVKNLKEARGILKERFTSMFKEGG